MVGLGAASDRVIRDYAVVHKAVVITKDQDFASLSHGDPDGTAVVWIRLGTRLAKPCGPRSNRRYPRFSKGSSAVSVLSR